MALVQCGESSCPDFRYSLVSKISLSIQWETTISLIKANKLHSEANPVESQKHTTTTKHLYQKRLAHAEALAGMEHVRYLAYQCASAHARWEVLAATSSQSQPDCNDTVRRYFDTGSYWGQHLFWAKWSYGDPDARRSTMPCWAHERHRETN